MKKEDPSKRVTRAIRRAVLRNAEPGEYESCTFFEMDRLSNFDLFFGDLDHYPVHWIAHAMHSCEIIGFKCVVDETIQNYFLASYRGFCEALHVLPETEAHLDLCLADDSYDDKQRDEYRNLSGGHEHIITEVKEVVKYEERRGYCG